MGIKNIIDENKQFEVARQYAILHSDYKFIKLILKDFSRRNVAGIHILEAYPYYDHKKRKEDFTFEIKGGATSFEVDNSMGGEFTYWILDDEWNRKLLASCYRGMYWVIEDPKINKEIKKMSDKIPSQLIGTPPHVLQMAEKISDIQRRLKVCSESEVPGLQEELKNLMESEIEKRTKTEVPVMEEEN